MRTKNVSMCIRTTMRQAWYKSLLKTSVFDIYFRSDADYVAYAALNPEDKVFLLTERGTDEQGAAHQNVRDSLIDGNDLGQYKLDILYLSPSIHLSRVKHMLDKMGVPHQGIRKIMQKHTCKFAVGYNEQGDAVSACRGMHGKVAPDIKKRNTLVISVNYQVPRNHCFKYFTLVDTKVSHGHNARDCP
jgi:hypothetical protein